MDANQLYEKLEESFIKPGLSDEWAKYMGEIYNFLCDNFKQRSMGLVCDFAIKIDEVYTAVFPSKAVMQGILDDGAQDAMLFVHHPSIWNIRNAPEIFQQMEESLLRQFKDRRISIYNLHVPLDNYNEYSTGKTLAEAIGAEIVKPFGRYYGSLAGVIARTNCKTVKELKSVLECAIGHEIKSYHYGNDPIKEGNLAILTGNGNILDILREVFYMKCNTFITGVTVRNEHYEKVHKYEEEKRINVIGGTHYSTEKFACQAMCGYFEKIGLPCEFMEGKPIMEDM